ncbi:sulfatase-like hydrolase/transferase [Flavobacterium sp.]|uniref:sulfatase-like hydrolase/transferase n=1 Tax=Flavobacterium sp. TaxID=239 RepID=UPI003C5518BA
MKLQLNIWLVAITLLSFFFQHSKTWSQTRPNIIVILTDDMGYADVGFNGGTNVATPNIDALANIGTVFSSAYVAHPFCGPSRTAIMTGRYPHKIGAQYNLAETDVTNGIDLNETFFSKVLQDAGYKTGAFGKWHLGQATAYKPNQRGFDYFYGFLPGGHNYTTATPGTNPYTWALQRNNASAGTANGLYITDLFSDEAVAFINNAESNDAQPFFMYIAYNAPHSPTTPLVSDVTAITSAPYNLIFPNTTDGNLRKDHAALVYGVDRGIKKIVDELKLKGEFDNTLIVFLSDNGGKVAVDGANNSPLKGEKGDTYEGGYRVPMFMVYPNHIAAGAKYNDPVSSLDFYPTFVDLAGGTIPVGKQLDGKNIYPNIIASTNARAGEAIYTLRHNGTGFNNVGIRMDQWKAFSTGNGVWQLYNIVNDIGETTNLASQNPTILKKMVEGAYQWSKTNVDALFFDSPAASTPWSDANPPTKPENTLPNYQKTFSGYTLQTPKFLNYKYAVSLHPNPAKSEVNIELNFEAIDEIDVYIYDATGRPVQVQKNLIIGENNAIKFKLNPNLVNGTYYVRLVSGDYSFSKGLIVKK